MSRTTNDQKTATRLVKRYLDGLGGARRGHVIDSWERALIGAIATSIAKARAEVQRRRKRRRALK